MSDEPTFFHIYCPPDLRQFAEGLAVAEADEDASYEVVVRDDCPPGKVYVQLAPASPVRGTHGSS